MLSEEKKEYLKKWLSQRLNEILGKAEDTLVDISDFKDRLSDQMDQASIESEIGLSLYIRGREAKLMRKSLPQNFVIRRYISSPVFTY